MDEQDVPARLAFALGRLNRRMRTAGGGLSHGLLSALATVRKEGPLRLAELSQIELVSAPSTTRLVADLEAQGLVSREADPDDGRAVLISITEKGEATILQARAARAAIISELFEQLEPSDVKAIVSALPALEKAIDAN
jgi:DNA-binding MarR family transcriptional regulator